MNTFGEITFSLQTLWWSVVAHLTFLLAVGTTGLPVQHTLPALQLLPGTAVHCPGPTHTGKGPCTHCAAVSHPWEGVQGKPQSMVVTDAALLPQQHAARQRHSGDLVFAQRNAVNDSCSDHLTALALLTVQLAL